MSLLEQTTLSPQSSYRTISLSKDKFAIVSPEDYEWLSKRAWHAGICNGVMYAERNEYLGDGVSRIVRMHREILGLKPGDNLIGDHINGDSMDNRRTNLRTVTFSQNMMNTCIRSNNSSGYRGVDFHKNSQLWRSRIAVNGKRLCLGYFDTKEEAAVAYGEASSLLFGEFARAS